ncbi:hypothetical protein E2C01_026028 [Portunus trituberculatus]|uniref:Uncharacterized protein n=1 Tax=Portunus trituberculatus TaxID=210409 RepID=A0A5B7EI23_PORTR|nr:hypothetical protein [Portunus trituberculatus]
MSRVAKRFYRVDSLHALDNLDRGESASEENRWVFEISHEAANKASVTVKSRLMLYFSNTHHVCLSFLSSS